MFSLENGDIKTILRYFLLRRIGIILSTKHPYEHKSEIICIFHNHNLIDLDRCSYSNNINYNYALIIYICNCTFVWPWELLSFVTFKDVIILVLLFSFPWNAKYLTQVQVKQNRRKVDNIPYIFFQQEPTLPPPYKKRFEDVFKSSVALKDLWTSSVFIYFVRRPVGQATKDKILYILETLVSRLLSKIVVLFFFVKEISLIISFLSIKWFFYFLYISIINFPLDLLIMDNVILVTS